MLYQFPFALSVGLAFTKLKSMLSARDTPLRTVLAAYGTIYSGWLYVLILLCTSSWVLFKVDWNSFVVCAAVSLAFFVGCLATFKFRTSVILRLPLWIPLILVPYFFSIYGPFYWGPRMLTVSPQDSSLHLKKHCFGKTRRSRTGSTFVRPNLKPAKMKKAPSNCD